MRMVEFPLEGGGTVLVQVQEDQPTGPVMRGGRVGDATIDRADRTFESALVTVRTVARGILSQLDGMAVKPQEVTAEFGVELTGKAGGMLVSAGASAQLTVSLTWRPGAKEQ
jgi:hypothetical protein